MHRFSYHGTLLACLLCSFLHAQTTTFPYQNPALSPHERAVDLCGRLMLDEKATLMEHESHAIERLGIP